MCIDKFTKIFSDNNSKYIRYRRSLLLFYLSTYLHNDIYIGTKHTYVSYMRVHVITGEMVTWTVQWALFPRHTVAGRASNRCPLSARLVPGGKVSTFFCMGLCFVIQCYLIGGKEMIFRNS